MDLVGVAPKPIINHFALSVFLVALSSSSQDLGVTGMQIMWSTGIVALPQKIMILNVS